MMDIRNFKGVITAAVTPFTADERPGLNNLQLLIQTLYKEGVDGILLLGTTGEGASLSYAEQEAVLEAGLDVSRDLIVMAGTGCASLPDTIRLTQRAFELGADAVVTVPPFYFKKWTNEGLANYFIRVLDEAVPEGRHLFLYDIPQTTGIPITHELMTRLLEHDEHKVGGVKDSTGDLKHAQEWIEAFPQLHIFVGTDKLLLSGLQAGAAGCITAGANLLAPLAVKVYRTFKEGRDAEAIQAELTTARAALERYLPFPATLKALLAQRFKTPGWFVRPPLVELTPDQFSELEQALRAATQFTV